MIEAFVAVLVVVAGAAYWLMVRRARARNPMPRPTKAGGRFGAVEIRTRHDACDSARALEGQRFLSKDAPALPLRDCTTAQCACRFTKLSDRRTDGRRLEHGGLSYLAVRRNQPAREARSPTLRRAAAVAPRAVPLDRRHRQPARLHELAQMRGGLGVTDERDAVEPDAVGDSQRRPTAAIDDAFEARAALDEKIDRARASRRDT